MFTTSTILVEELTVFVIEGGGNFDLYRPPIYIPRKKTDKYIVDLKKCTQAQKEGTLFYIKS